MKGTVLLTPEPLDPQVDRAFLDFNAAVLEGRQPFAVEGFCEAVYAFLDGSVGAWDRHNELFNRFTQVFQVFLRQCQYGTAEELWEKALLLALEWESRNPEARVHKGTPLYFWAMAAILGGNLDRGYALMHQSLMEDVRTSGEEYPLTPAFAFVRLDYLHPRQAFGNYVTYLADFLDTRLLQPYRAGNGRELTIDALRDRFLEKPAILETVFLFSYLLARMALLEELPADGMKSSFAGQLELELLFHLALVIESSIEAATGNHSSLPDQLGTLANQSGLHIDESVLKSHVNAAFNDAGFDQTLGRLLDEQNVLGNDDCLRGLEADMAVAYGIRNHAAHNISGDPVIWERYVDIRQSLFNVLFLTVETFYLEP